MAINYRAKRRWWVEITSFRCPATRGNTGISKTIPANHKAASVGLAHLLVVAYELQVKLIGVAVMDRVAQFRFLT